MPVEQHDPQASEVAGYTLLEKLDTTPAGHVYRARRVGSWVDVRLRCISREWLAQNDDEVFFLAEAERALPVSHPHLAKLIDVTETEEDVIIVSEWIDGLSLFDLVSDMGPMPVLLAVDYIRQAALGLAEADVHGLVHGHLRPQQLIVGPLVLASKPKPDGTPRLRPVHDAKVRVTELGTALPIGANPFSTSERSTAGDVRSLGATLHFLLSSRFIADGPLQNFRADCPAELLVLLAEMTHTDPTSRPVIQTVIAQLQMLLNPKKVLSILPEPVEQAVSIGQNVTLDTLRDSAILSSPKSEQVSWQAFATPSTSDVYLPEAVPWTDEAEVNTTTRPQYRKPTETPSPNKLWLLLGAFITLNLMAFLFWYLMMKK